MFKFKVMKKIISTILILFYVFASFGFGSIHYFCDMSLNSSYSLETPECACRTTKTSMQEEPAPQSCCVTEEADFSVPDRSLQTDVVQLVMDCCSAELNYHQANAFVLKINELQGQAYSNLQYDVIVKVPFKIVLLSNTIMNTTISQQHNLPLLI